MPTTTAGAARDLRADIPDVAARTGAWSHAVLTAGLLDLPPPGTGSTMARFQALSDLGSVDLDLARLAEGHADAVAINRELGFDRIADGLWGVWAANPPTDPVVATTVDGGWVLKGTKPWCSGAGYCDRAFVSAQADDGYRLFAVDVSEPGLTPVDGTWPASAMQGSDSRSVRLVDVPAVAVGGVDAYLDRPGFWHGAVGVAAVWWGGARGIARALARSHRRRPLNPHALAHAGAVDAGLVAAEAMLRAAAAEFDADPLDLRGTARLTAGRTRAVVEDVATEVMERTGRALGAGPLTQDADHGKLVADLTVYLRQSHAERDLEALGTASLAASGPPWCDPDETP